MSLNWTSQLITGPFFFIAAKLNGVKCLQLVTGQIVPTMQCVAGNDFDDVWYQQDGAPAHYRLIVFPY